jgi:hypothetical protein
MGAYILVLASYQNVSKNNNILLVMEMGAHAAKELVVKMVGLGEERIVVIALGEQTGA